MSKNKKVLLIVESPSKVKTIKKYLPNDNNYSVLASVGHVVDLSHKYKHRLGVNIDKDFEPHFVINKDKIDVMQSILDGASVVDKVILCTDPDREGEAIAYHLYKRLKPLKKEIKRAEFHTLDAAGIKDGLSKERDINYDLVDAAIARRVLDRIVGFMGSPFVIKRISKGCSAGRVQSVALKLVVEREEEINNFKPEEYWNIKVDLKKFSENSFFASLYEKNTIASEKEAMKIEKELETSNYIVKKVVAKSKNRNPYPPLNTAKLQMVASSKLGITSSRSMAAAQELYQNGKITYIRTDSVRLSPDSIKMAREWILKNHSNCLPSKPINYKNKNTIQDAHEAIRPTNASDLPKDKPKTDEEKVYKLIWEYFIASQMKPAVYDTISVIIETNKKRVLKTNGRTLKEAGWLCLLGIEEDDDNEKDKLLPPLVVKDILKIGKEGVIADQKFTKPPPRYKEHTLVKDLEDKGIGRPSTYATIMKTICETRNFIDKKNKSLVPTEIGTKIVKLLDDYFKFMEYNYTSKLENKLDLISHGKCTYLETMEDFFKGFKLELNKAYSNTTIETDYECTICKNKMLLKKSALGYFLGCSDYPKCKNIMSCEVVNDKITLAPDKNKNYAPSDIKCPKCLSKMIIRVGKFGKFYSCENYPECRGSRKIPYGKKCPKCGNELYRNIFRQGPVLCCMGYPKCRYIEELKEDGFEEKQKTIMNDIKNNTKKVEKVQV
jgi:DNA topoisomerase-1